MLILGSGLIVNSYLLTISSDLKCYKANNELRPLFYLYALLQPVDLSARLTAFEHQLFNQRC